MLAFLAMILVVLASPSIGAESAEAEPTPEPRSTGDPQIAIEDLAALVKPLTRDELIVEADAWLALLQAKVEEISNAQIHINRRNREIDVAGGIASGSERDQATGRVEDRAAELLEAQSLEAKSETLENLKVLREERTALIDRLNVVLADLAAKFGKTADGKEPDEIVAYRRYIDAVSGITLDVSDVQAVRATIWGWITSEQGGVRWAKNLLVFAGIVLAFWMLSRLASKAVATALDVANVASELLRRFLVGFIRRAVLAVGLVVGLAALEINIGPLLALIGAAGFVVAFALQDTLSNFASGMMIMFYKPYDVGDFIDVGGVAGTVQSMNLVSTTVTTVDNKLMVVPNNSIWGNVITNVTGSSERRVDLMFGIGYDDDIDKAERILRDIVARHELVLPMPETVIQLHELGDSSVNFIVRPWAKTPDYFTVFWDVTRQVKQRFDQEGISIPYPQRDVHLHYGAPAPESIPKESRAEGETVASDGQFIDGDTKRPQA